MRDLLFKNLTSGDRKRRVVSSSEITDKKGIHSVIRRHFICLIKEVKSESQTCKPSPSIQVLRERDSKTKLDRFSCRIKGSVYASSGERLFLILFMHSLKITLTPKTKNSPVYDISKS